LEVATMDVAAGQEYIAGFREVGEKLSSAATRGLSRRGARTGMPHHHGFSCFGTALDEQPGQRDLVSRA
jgi:hypothetical protein